MTVSIRFLSHNEISFISKSSIEPYFKSRSLSSLFDNYISEVIPICRAVYPLDVVAVLPLELSAVFCYVFNLVSVILKFLLRLFNFRSNFIFFELKLFTDLCSKVDLVLYKVEKAVVISLSLSLILVVRF